MSEIHEEGQPEAGHHAGVPLLAPERSVRLAWSWAPGPVWWGATWAALCGGVVALPWPDGWGAGLLSWFAAWLGSVVLFGTVWAPAAGADEAAVAGIEPRALRMGAPPGALRSGWLRAEWGRAAERLERVSPGAVERVALAGAAVVVSTLAAPAAGLLVALAAVAVLAFEDPTWRPAVGGRRTLLEIGLPAAVAWLALDGPARLPITWPVTASLLAAVLLWLQANAVFLALVGCFLLAHFAATAVRTRTVLPMRHGQLVLAYGGLVALEAAAGSPLAALTVALLFILQWPYQAAFRRGRVRWHLLHSQGLAMAAMLVASAGVAGG